MSTAVAVLAAVVATVLSAAPRRSGRRLAKALLAGAPSPDASRPSAPAVWLVAAVSALVIGLTLGLWLGLGAAGLAVLLGRRRARPALPLDVPLLADLLAACLAAGATVGDALHAAGAASPQAAEACRPVAAGLSAGAVATEAWAEWLGRPDLAPIARACVRAADSGSATSQELRRAGDRARAQRRAELARRAHRAAVWAVLPLGMCFLPAFVLVGIVPFALGLLGR